MGSFLGLAYNQDVDASVLEQFHYCVMAFLRIDLVFSKSVSFCLCPEMPCLQTQPTLTNEEGIQPQLLEGFQVSPQVLNSIISEHVSPRAPGSAVILVYNPLHQELWPAGEVNRLASPCEQFPTGRTPTRFPSTQKYLPSMLTGWVGPSISRLYSVSLSLTA